MQIGETKHLKTCEELGKTMNEEDSRDLWRHYKRRNYVLKSKDILYGRKHPKRRWNKWLHAWNYTDAPRACWHATWACTMLPGHDAIRQGHCFCTHVPQHAPWACCERVGTVFFHFLSGKTQLFRPNPGGNFVYKYNSSHSWFFHSERSGSRARQALRALREESLLTLSL